MKVLCIGLLGVDILVRPVNEVDFAIDTTRVEKIALKSGGDAMNTAVNLARLGTEVRFVGRIGNDFFGKFLAEVFRSLSIDCQGLLITDGCPSESCVVLVNEKGERKFLYHHTTECTLSSDDVKTEWLEGCSVVHIGGAFALPGIDGEGAARIFREAHKKGAVTTMDVTYDSSGRWLENISPCLSELDYFFPSINEAKHIAGSEEPEIIADFLLERGVKTVVIKLGANGCFVKNSSERFYQKAYKAKVADTTGAGDAFVAGFLSGLESGLSLRECAKRASAAGSACVEQLGATNEKLNLEQIERLIRKEEY